MVNGTDEPGRIASMTGFASIEALHSDISYSWEIRGVNGRGLDLRFRLPDGLGALEAELRKRLSSRLARGSVSLSLRFNRSPRGAATSAADLNLQSTLERIAEVHAAADAAGVSVAPMSAAAILDMQRATTDTDGPSHAEPFILLADADRLLTRFEAMRHAEGCEIGSVLTEQLDRIAALIQAAQAAAASRGDSHAERLRENVKALVEDGELDEARLLQEVALLAVKSDVTEEIDRLIAHVAAARDLLANGGPVGRKLDFLMQEFNREANTLCSKSQDAALTAIGLDLKLAIDQTREQVQNVE